MAERSIIDQLDDAVTALLAKREPAVNEANRELAELLAVARELRGLPSEEFRAALKEQLEGKDNMSTATKQIESTQPSQTITPYLTYRDAAAAIDFYKRAFGATELMRLAEPSGKIGHAELKIGNTRRLADQASPVRRRRGPVCRACSRGGCDPRPAGSGSVLRRSDRTTERSVWLFVGDRDASEGHASRRLAKCV